MTSNGVVIPGLRSTAHMAHVELCDENNLYFLFIVYIMLVSFKRSIFGLILLYETITKVQVRCYMCVGLSHGGLGIERILGHSVIDSIRASTFAVRTCAGQGHRHMMHDACGPGVETWHDICVGTCAFGAYVVCCRGH